MNNDIYLDILKENIGAMSSFRYKRIFMHDNAPCHTATKVKNWFKTKKY